MYFLKVEWELEEEEGVGEGSSLSFLFPKDCKKKTKPCLCPKFNLHLALPPRKLPHHISPTALHKRFLPHAHACLRSHTWTRSTATAPKLNSCFVGSHKYHGHTAKGGKSNLSYRGKQGSNLRPITDPVIDIFLPAVLHSAWRILLQTSCIFCCRLKAFYFTFWSHSGRGRRDFRKWNDMSERPRCWTSEEKRGHVYKGWEIELVDSVVIKVANKTRVMWIWNVLRTGEHILLVTYTFL